MQTTTPGNEYAIAKKIAEFWLPHLERTEDLFKHLEYVDKSSKEIRAHALKMELQAFDDKLTGEVPRGWRLKEYRQRTIITLVGKITYLRRIYQEPCGICHAYLDEILGIRTRMKLAPDAFLWVVKTAADISFRKTAGAFYERTGASISHWLVMACVHEEGALLLEEAFSRAFKENPSKESGLPYSSETLFVEFDGISVPLQKTTHEPRKVRWVYEKDRKSRHFELKVGCFYAGKDKKRRRLGCSHFSFDGASSYFWPLLNAQIAAVYDTEVIEEVHVSSDAAGWCKNSDLAVVATARAATFHLDRFHINRAVHRAFGGATKRASHFISLLYKKRLKRALRDLQFVINQVSDEKDKERYLDLQNYLRSNEELISTGAGPSQGCQEGTNAHVYAARMKVWGGAWSRRGAAAMAAIRACLFSGKKLIPPAPDNALYDDFQIAQKRRYRESLLLWSFKSKEMAGAGWEPPKGRIALTTHMDPHLYGVVNYSR
jgi:hypothetical protein